MKNKLMIAIFLCFIGGLGFMHFVTKDVQFSERENRMLAQMPTFSLEKFLSGDFTKDFEKYVTDQFVWKGFWTKIKANTETITLKKENNGIYLGKNGYLLERFEKPGEQLQSNIESLKYFSNKAHKLNTYFLMAPTSVEIYSNKLPLYAQSYSEKKIMTSVGDKLNSLMTFINVSDALNQRKNEPIYFKTDHHWTMRGAYYAYEATAKAMGLKPYGINDFNIEEVSDDFYGTFYTKANAPHYKPDKIEVFKPKFDEFDVNYHVEYEDVGTSSNSLYEPDYLKKRDQYSYFLNGNHSLVKITSSVKNGQKLMVIKDSYAHAFIPFLANHYEEIHVVDLRYYHLNLYDYLAKNKIENVLFLYNAANFSKDTNMLWLKQ